MPLVTVAYFVRNFGPLVQFPVNALLEGLGERLTLNLTVDQILWGYDEPLFKLIQPIISIPGFDEGKFGFLLQFNYTTLNLYTVNTGKENQSLLNDVVNFQGLPQLDWWGTPATNEILGTDGTMYHPYMSREENLYLFHPDLCR
ncbi:scavenger receptor class B member 1-like [Lytechinus pictus]|uniref:scavenger receptor class B member 1-like n=1 Tax=Lytechinus pictus TaxID=7653 RepID=UPI00240D2A16|nr:scavenger receptor class B member 1-like [Lytechinus pictus]